MVYEEEVVELRQRVARLERTVDFLLKQLNLTYVDNVGSDIADPELAELIQRGKKIEAIKLYRERTGAGLAEAKAFVDKFGL